MIEMNLIETSRFKLDGGAMFGVVPQVLWGRHYEPDQYNRIGMAARTLLVRHDDRRILVDVGVGSWHEKKYVEMFAIEEPDFDFDEALSGLGESTETITDIIITHLHFDHAGGLVKRCGGELVAAFPRAKIHLQKRQWKWALAPSPKDRASFLPAYLEMLRGSDHVDLIEGDGTIGPYVSVMPVDGHTPGMQTVLIEGPERTVFYPSDLIPTAGHVRIPYIMAYDNEPLVTIREKEKFLAQAAEDNWLIYFEHDVGRQAAGVVEQNGRFELR